jgi:hypothetical protein
MNAFYHIGQVSLQQRMLASIRSAPPSRRLEQRHRRRGRRQRVGDDQLDLLGEFDAFDTQRDQPSRGDFVAAAHARARAFVPLAFGNFWGNAIFLRPLFPHQKTGGIDMPIILWALGVPISLIILAMLFGAI